MRHGVWNIVFAALVLPSLAFPANLVLRFANASDGHWGRGGINYQQDFHNLVQWLNGEKAGKGLDFAVIVGDNVDYEIDQNHTYLKATKPPLDSLSMPYYVVHGNHDTATDSLWTALWGYPRNYDVAVGNYAVILGNSAGYNGVVECTDATWLGNRMNFYSAKKYVFLFIHVPPQSGCGAVTGLVASHPNVAAVYSGHDHNSDGYSIVNGKFYCYDGRFGSNWGLPYHGYRITEVYDDGSITSYQYDAEHQVVKNTYNFGTVGMEKAEGERLKAEKIGLEAKPNPASGGAAVHFQCPPSIKPTRLIIYNTAGKRVALLASHPSPLASTFTWNASAMPSGVYIARLKAGERVLTKRILLEK